MKRLCNRWRHRRSPRSRYLPVRLSALLGVGCSTLAALLVWQSEQGRAAYRFQQNVEDVAVTLDRLFDRYTNVPETLGTVSDLSDALDPDQFQQLSTSFLRRYPAIERLAWSQRVTADDRPDYERQLRDRNLPRPYIWERDRQRTVISAPSRRESLPLTYIAPASLYTDLVGFNWLAAMPSDPPKWERQTLALDDRPGFLTAIDRHPPLEFRIVRAIRDRDRRIKGAIAVDYALDRLVAQALDNIAHDSLDFYLLDLGNPLDRQLLLYYDATRQSIKHAGARNVEPLSLHQSLCPVYRDCTRTLSVGDRHWLLVVRPTARFPRRSLRAEATLTAGLLLTSAVSAYLWLALRRTEDIERAKYALEQSQHELHEQTRWERLIERLASQIRNSFEIDTILNTVVRELRKLLHVDRSYFCWYRPDRQTWEVVAESRDPRIASLLHHRYSVEDSGLVPNPGRHLCRHASDRDDDAACQFWQSFGIVCCVSLPVRTPADTLGLLVLAHDTPRGWRDRELDSLDTVATQLAVALHSAELYQNTCQKAEALARTVEKLQSTQSQLVQTEKMSSLGQLVAGIAHEINNPVNFISGNLAYVREYAEGLLTLLQDYRRAYPDPPEALQDYAEDIDLAFLMEDLPKILNSMQVGTDRIQEIVRSMRTFSRVDESDMKPVDLHAGIESTLTILQSRFKGRDGRPAVAIVRDYGELPDRVKCYAGQLNQVFMNLLANSLDALEMDDDGDRPQIVIRTRFDDLARVWVSFSDNGPGIPPEVRDRLFDPFFTTKPIGKGTGLGLSICYQIVVEKHGGELSCESQVGQGTTFTVGLPPECVEEAVRPSAYTPKTR